MIVRRVAYVAAALSVGALLAGLRVPAGWLIGAIVTGLVCSVLVKKMQLPDWLFKVSLGVIGANIGFILKPTQFVEYHQLLLPFLLTLCLTLAGGVLLGRFMHRFSGLDANTAFFCCLPGGASEAIALSKEYGANQSIVAAYHTTRILFFVLTIPVVAGISRSGSGSFGINGSWGTAVVSTGLLALSVLAAVLLARRLKFPGSLLLFSILIGFVASSLVPEAEIPRFVPGIGQGLLGAVIGLRFDNQTMTQLKKIGATALISLLLYFVLSVLLATIFYGLTPLDWFTSLLSVVPAGAAEMSSTAMALDIEPALVATLQMARLLAVFFAMPLLIHRFVRRVEAPK
ncbi:AbrB family transcriptional regulator [Paenibacillus sp. IB182496]|uniref:AbrB family transcriptional regulator n=2 Tax=Paenibacillus sabuli TaxID=2772509 RepID=A0A927GPY8_9BACL|nr:AbrB family transcriptional regulator [Paenibacillus sabuli]